jgi:hypothetical protein
MRKGPELEPAAWDSEELVALAQQPFIACTHLQSP